MKRLWLIVAFVVAATALWFFVTRSDPQRRPSSIQDVASAHLSSLTRLDGRLCRTNDTRPFTGFAIEQHQNGTLKSRSMIVNGLLHGLSEGWFTNGQKQVTETFTNGVSHGLRTKWYADGQKHSEAQIVAAQLHGTFRRWHPNGVLAEQAQFDHGQPDGTCYAYLDTGDLKRTVTMQRGTMLTQQSFNNGELMSPAQPTGE